MSLGKQTLSKILLSSKFYNISLIIPCILSYDNISINTQEKN